MSLRTTARRSARRSTRSCRAARHRWRADMTALVNYDDVEVGTPIPEQTFAIQRVDLIKYAGASGDFNIIHWRERAAPSVGLPDVIAHGMFTMAEAGRVLTDWAGDPAAVEEYSVRFSRPI